MSDALRQLCFFSVFSGLVLFLTPEGRVKKIVEIGAAAAMVLSILQIGGSIDLQAYRLELAQGREREQAMLREADELSDRLNRTVIEDECEAYIQSWGRELGCEIEPELTARWDMEGVWVPYEVSIKGELSEENRRSLEERILAELGIPPERQMWEHEAD